jgi:hypothetical protein
MNNDRNLEASLWPGQHAEPEDLLFFVLQMLPPADHAAVEAHLAAHFAAGCAQCQAELAGLREDIGLYAVATLEPTMTEAPEHSRDRLMAEVMRSASSSRSSSADVSDHATMAAKFHVTSVTQPALQVMSGTGVESGSGSREAQSTNWLSWAGWAAAAALTFAATHYYQQTESLRESLAGQASQIARLSADQARAREVVDALTDRSAQRVALSLTKAPTPSQPSGRATYLARKGTLIFLASHLAPLPAGKTYELWVIPASGAPSVPAGIFKPDAQGNANVVTARLNGIGAAKAFGVTIENEGGSRTPTMPIVLAGS